MSSFKRRVDALIVVGPTACGKTTFIRRLVAANPNYFSHCVTHTTRLQRSNEVPGKSYHFVTVPEFEQLTLDGAMLEHSLSHGNRYGASWAALHTVLAGSLVACLALNMEGAANVSAQSNVTAKRFWLGPPSIEILAARLRGRGTEPEHDVLLRIKAAESEIRWHARHPDFFHRSFLVDDWDVAFDEFRIAAVKECIAQTS